METSATNREVRNKKQLFELGGHSLKATALVSKIHKEMSVEVPLREVFTYQTIIDLAQYIKMQNKVFMHQYSLQRKGNIIL